MEPVTILKSRVARGNLTFHALTDPDVNLSAHPAPIVQPLVENLPANAQTVVAVDELIVPASALLFDGGLSISCISSLPIASEYDQILET